MALPATHHGQSVVGVRGQYVCSLECVCQDKELEEQKWHSKTLPQRRSPHDPGGLREEGGRGGGRGGGREGRREGRREGKREGRREGRREEWCVLLAEVACTCPWL